MSIFKQPISELIWDSKYRYRYHGSIIDQNIEATWRRVAKAIAKAEKSPPERQYWEKQFQQLLTDFRFLPGGRILAGAGTKHKITLFNCFVMNIAEDSLSGIFDALKEGALTLQQGGGVGYDFSTLRPEGELVKKTGIPASGPVSFMRIWDSMCAVLLSTGTRRGAMMGVLRCDHPDIEKFISAKADPHELRHFNVSVMVSDAFIEAVKQNADWPLIFPTDQPTGNDVIYHQWGNTRDLIPCRVYRRIKARDLWEQITKAAYHYAEPGVLFSDTINRTNNLWYGEYISATNPCAEIPLPPYGACDLGAINLTQFINYPFTDRAQINWQALEETTSIATRFLDNVIDVSRYPLNAQRQQAFNTRRIGLGLTGLADALVMLGMRYGSPESITFASKLMQRISTVTWQTSIELAKEKGSFPMYSSDYLKGEYVKKLPSDLYQALEKSGVRNSHHNTVAPTGTTSLLANNVSNGIEPIFKSEYARHVRMADDQTKLFQVTDYAYDVWRQITPEGMPAAWVEAHDLSPLAHLQVQGAIQPFVDNAISKTINLPRDFPFDQLTDVYMQAYLLGLKGCTIFRPNEVTGSVLEEPITDQCCKI